MSKHVVSQPASWPLWAKIVVSLLIVWHFFAIFLAVTSEGYAGGRPELAYQLYYSEVPWTHGYLKGLFLTNAYRFFAPNPGPTTLIWFRLQYEDGSVRWVELPDGDEFVLRMPYQRRLALAMAIGQNIAFDREGRPFLSVQGKAYLSSYVRHVAKKFPKVRTGRDGSTTLVPVEKVQVTWVQHHWLEPWQVWAGWEHTDLRNYEYAYLGTYDVNGEIKQAPVFRDSFIGFGVAEFAALVLVQDVYPLLEQNRDLSEPALPPPIQKLLRDFPELYDPEARRKILREAAGVPATEVRDDARVGVLALQTDAELRRRVEETPLDKFHDLLKEYPLLNDTAMRLLEVRLLDIIARNDRNVDPPLAPATPPVNLPGPPQKPSPGALDKTAAPIR
jgi:hypothetical protein